MNVKRNSFVALRRRLLRRHRLHRHRNVRQLVQIDRRSLCDQLFAGHELGRGVYRLDADDAVAGQMEHRKIPGAWIAAHHLTIRPERLAGARGPVVLVGPV